MRLAILAAVTVAFAAADATPASAQEGGEATVLTLDKDRSGKRHANRWTVRCDSVGQVWSTGDLKKSTRKMYVRAGATALRIGTAAPVGSIGDILNGSQVQGWSTLEADQGRDYGNPQRLYVICTGPGQFYAHAEWYRRARLFEF